MRIINMLSAVIVITAIISCNKYHQASQNCQYKKFAGKAKIISISSAPTDENNCPLNPKKVIFAFTPNDSNAINNYLFRSWSDTSTLKINAGTNPSQNFLDSLNIFIGSEFICNRQEISQGTCTPVVFEFTTIKLFPQNGCR